jgi:hypothetical protein
VDVHIALAARDQNAAVITSDRDDIVAVSPSLKDLIIEI